MKELINTIIFDDNKNILPKILDKSVNLIFTDIPYNISRENNFKTMGRSGIDFGIWDKNIFKETDLLPFIRVLKNNGSFFSFHSFEQFGLLQKIFENELFYKDKIIWEKTNPMPRNRDRRWVSNIEIASWYTKSLDWTFNRQDINYENSVLKYPVENGSGYERWHETQKNLKMYEYLIKIHSNENDLILDPYCGGGTTAIACLHTNRNFICIESDEKNYNRAIERLKVEKRRTIKVKPTWW